VETFEAKKGTNRAQAGTNRARSLLAVPLAWLGVHPTDVGTLVP
jgi:hypothetical protein